MGAKRRRPPVEAEPVKEATALTRADPLREASAEVWARWSQDAEARALQRKIAQAAAELEQRNMPIYPAELARRIAQDTATLAPDWRATDGVRGAAWGKLLKMQPELQPELTKQREATIAAILNSLPSHLHPTINELRTLIKFLLAGHEAAAYLVGFEAGRLREQQHVDNRGRLRHGRKPPRRPAGLRLTLEPPAK